MQHYRKLLIAALLSGLSLVPVFVFLAWLSSTVSQEDQFAKVAAAFQSQELTDNDYLWDDRRRGLDNFSDCALLGMTLSRRATALENALYVQSMNVPGSTLCAGLRRLVTPPHNMEWAAYHRYWHGSKVALGLLLGFLDVGAIRQFYVLLQSLAWIALALAAWRTGKRTAAFMSVIVVFGVFFSGGPYYGPSIAHAPGFISSTVMAALALFTSGHWRGNPRRTGILLGIWGAVAIYFDTSQPIHLVFAGLTIALLDAEERMVRPKAILDGWMAFCLSAVVLIVAKQLLASIVAEPQDSVFGKFTESVVMRTTGSNTPGVAQYSFLAVWPALRDTFFILGWGMRGASDTLTWFAASGWIGGAIFVIVRSNKPVLFPILTVLLGTMGWYAVFNSHALTHRWFMTRPLFLLLGVGWATIAWLIADKRGKA